MGTSHLMGHGKRATAPTERIPGRSDMVENNAGGFAWEVGPRERLRRFLILGSEGGSYYASERDLTAENIASVHDAIDQLGVDAVTEIVAISDAGRAPKNDQAIYALACAVSYGEITNAPAKTSPARAAWEENNTRVSAVRSAAYAALPAVCRTATHLFLFISFVREMRGWGPGLVRAVARWYEDQPVERVALQVVKYRNRHGFSHHDVMRLSHPRATGPSQAILYDWIKGEQPNAEAKEILDRGLGVGPDGAFLPEDDALRVIEGFERVQRARTAASVRALIEDYKLPREALPTQWLKDASVWEALLFTGGKYGMPITALVRNLANMTRVGLLAPGSDATAKVCEMLVAEKLLTHGRVHPVTLLKALRVYASGRSIDGRGEPWAAVGNVVDALDAGFYASFGALPKTGQRYLLGVDVSGSMDGRNFRGGFPNCTGSPELTPREAAMAMAMVQAHTGDTFELTAFTAARGAGYGHYDELPQVMPGLSVLPFTSRQRLDDILKATAKIFPGGTDGSLPMLYAAKMERKVDVFVLYTDAENWAGRLHPVQALQEYRRQSGINAKLICVNMVSNKWTIADPTDVDTLDVVGFDAGAPQVMAEFAAGALVA